MHVELYDGVKFAKGTLSFLKSPVKTCFYVVDGLLIDTGPRNLARESIPFFQESFIEQVALTHFHEDHVGMSAWLIKHKEAEVLIHPETVKDTLVRKKLPWHRRKSWGVPEPFVSKPLPDVLERENHRFEVIPTPGHTDDHVCFFERDKGWLFTGDFYLYTNPVQWAPDESAAKMIDSLNRVLDLDFDSVFCGHAGIRSNGKALIKAKLDYLLDLQDKVCSLVEKGYSLRQINNKLFPSKPPSTYITRGEWSSYHMISSLFEASI